MIAGSRTGSARDYAGDQISVPEARAWLRRVAGIRAAGTWPLLTGLYLLAAALLLLPWPFGAHPAWAYNWEGYTAWRWEQHWQRPGGWTLSTLAVTDGLMTDSGQGPLVGLPITIGIALAGFDLDAMRVPVTLLAAAAVPVLWLLGRRVAGAGPATLAALLLAISPAFLVYGRTATLVGASLLPLLLSALALARVLDPRGGGGWRWSREGLFVASQLLGIYAYAPVRLFWPLAVALLGIAAWRHPARRGVLLGTALLALLIVPLGVAALEWLTMPAPQPATAVLGYFHARGEQLVAMSDDPAAAGQYVRTLGEADVSGWEAAWRLIGQNSGDLARLLLDRDTLPAPSDYWNERGRFWPWLLLPFALVGGLAAASKGWRSGAGASARLVPLLACLGLALPLLLTSRVHIGRLLPALPFALLLAAAGVWICAGWLASLAYRAPFVFAFSVCVLGPVLSGVVLAPVVLWAHADMATPLAPSPESRVVTTLAGWAADARERGGAVLVEDPALGDDIERVHAATYRLDLDHTYRFVDLQHGQAADVVVAEDDSRPVLLWRGALGALQAGTIANACDRLWFVGPEITDEFVAAWRSVGCAGVPNSVVLP